jgi:hypothetical protein
MIKLARTTALIACVAAALAACKRSEAPSPQAPQSSEVSAAPHAFAFSTAREGEAPRTVDDPALLALAKPILDEVYSGYDEAGRCWKTEAEGLNYCMELDRVDRVNAPAGERLYLLARGSTADGGHPTPGLIGAFVLERQQGRWAMLSGDARMNYGAYGNAPANWKFVKVGPSDYWGWLNTHGDVHQGYAGSWYIVLAPYGKKIKDLAGMTAEYSDAGACNEDDKVCEQKTSDLDSTLEIDTSRIQDKVFPLRIAVMGKNSGKTLAPQTWEFTFSEKNWNYVMPPGYLLENKEF